MSRILALALPLCALFACATARPPAELVQAREAYATAESGIAAKLVPSDVHLAREQLDAAEKSFNNDADSADTVDISYIALRKAQRAQALGEAAASMQAKAQADKDHGRTTEAMLSSKDAQLKDTQGTLAQERTALEKERTALEKSQGALAQQKEMTAAERAARLEAEKKSQDAMDALAKSLAVKSDPRGTVITLSGGVVFATNQATILPGAQTQLNQVADALKTEAEHHFSVEGHTDDQGTDKVNDDLSTRRANAVRDYLVVRGVSANAITAAGFGSHRPIGDNKTPEGRAMNRRVEIIVDKNPS